MNSCNPTREADNHNTNQNKAACTNNSMPMMDQFQEPTFLPGDGAPSLNLEVNVKNETNFFPTIPTIIITPASPDNYSCDILSAGNSYSCNLKQSSDNSLILGHHVQESSSDVPSLLDVDLLSTPQTDTTINIQRPPSAEADSSLRQQTSRVSATASEELEVMCRFSSTPVMSTSRKGQSLHETDCSMISINDASPIAPDDSSVSTPNRSSNRSISQEEDNHDASNMHQNIMYVHPQYVIQNQPHSMMRRDLPLAQNSQPSFVAGRIIDPGYMPGTYMSAGAYTGTQNVYSAYVQGASCYSDYFPTRDSSWTDLSYRSDTSPVPPASGSQVDSCCYPMPSGSPVESEYFVYPSIYVSSSGLISVLLRNDMSVEMTVDRTIRVVSHNHMMAVATDSRGTAACLYHPAVKVFQIGTTTDIATLNFRARMGADVIVFSNGVNFFKLEDSELQPTAPVKFTDIFRDQSVNLLFSSEGYGESLVASCMQVAAQAEYANLPKGGVIVRINGVKVTQTGGGDVTVVTGAKFIRLSPHFGTTRLGNRFVDIEVEKDWTVKLTRGSHSFVYSKKRAMVCNGKMEAGFDENNGLKVINLQLRLPLLAEPSIVRRPCRKQPRGPSAAATPKRRPGPTSTGRGSGMT